jgi:hypothetical protein
MAEQIVHWTTIYGAAGLLVALVFLLWGIDRIDAGATASYAFRPLLVPGIVLLWPVVVIRWAYLARRQS